LENRGLKGNNFDCHALPAADAKGIRDGFEKRKRLQLLFAGRCNASSGQSAIGVSWRKSSTSQKNRNQKKQRATTASANNEAKPEPELLARTISRRYL
jgi:hypothetical protein